MLPYLCVRMRRSSCQLSNSPLTQLPNDREFKGKGGEETPTVYPLLLLCLRHPFTAWSKFISQQIKDCRGKLGGGIRKEWSFQFRGGNSWPLKKKYHLIFDHSWILVNDSGKIHLRNNMTAAIFFDILAYLVVPRKKWHATSRWRQECETQAEMKLHSISSYFY